MRPVVVNGLRFMTGVAGAGPRLLFLTGSGADLRKRKTPLNGPLAAQFEVLSYDQRGMGQSDKPDRPYSMQDYAEDAIAILDAYGWDRVRIVGYSFGGMVAQEIALGWPKRVQKLALVATTAGGEGGSSYPIQNLADLPPRERARKGLEIVDLGFTPDWQATHPKEAAARITARVAAQTRFADEPGAAIGRRRQLAARACHDTFDRLTNITAPTLVLAGQQDGQAPVAAQRAMARRIPNCRFQLIDGTHQMVWNNAQTNEIIAEFMKDVA
ncbi:alpha/beta hydrolase [Phaeobacter sp. J2-8]|uniref:alpha/beta fold hydrolase n=1 Tax=Phaeobacter sp. J2-8 TaxID=2931394 RepID=UPI001FD56F31|nr:alpha/beta hydrolase [Phaeobacter sp. J2-8]MCJ7873434.1 alpha/beta hydrolase [Phaeobacter sp. J2-8]